MAIFSNITLQKRVLGAGQLFSSFHVWNDRPSFHKKNLQGKDAFSQQNSTFDYLHLLETKSRKIITNVAR